METITKIGPTTYEITGENSYIIDIKTINDNIKGIRERLRAIKKEESKLLEQKAEQEALKETLLKIK